MKSEQSEIIVVVCMSVLWVEHHLEGWGGNQAEKEAEKKSGSGNVEDHLIDQPLLLTLVLLLVVVVAQDHHQLTHCCPERILMLEKTSFMKSIFGERGKAAALVNTVSSSGDPMVAEKDGPTFVA